MSKGKYELKGRHQRRTFGGKYLVLLLACVLLVIGVVGGSVAWLTARTTEVKNVFSSSNIGVELKESENLNFKMIPGWDITKDPKAWITEGSEDAYLFVKVEESANFDSFMTYEIADGWTALTGVDGVYYRQVTSTQMGEESAFTILKDEMVTVKGDVTKELMTALDFTQPTLTLTAYAHQLYQSQNQPFDVTIAWNNLNPSN